jgi:large subunit ribosomal protein L1
MQYLRRLPCSHGQQLVAKQLRSLKVAASKAVDSATSETDGEAAIKVPSRWRLLRAARKAAPPPKHRSEYKFDRSASYMLPTALEHVRSSSWAGFDETVELIFRLNIDPRKADQNIRGLIELPHGPGAPRPVAVFAYPGPAADEAVAAGADVVGVEDLTEQIVETKGKLLKGYAGCVATPEVMPILASKLGRILGPKGIMPNHKLGTVTGAVADAVRRLKHGCTYRTDRNGNIHLVAGKLSFSDEHLIENCFALARGIIWARPETVKKKYFTAAYVSSTMGPSVTIDVKELTKLALEAVAPP